MGSVLQEIYIFNKLTSRKWGRLNTRTHLEKHTPKWSTHVCSHSYHDLVCKFLSHHPYTVGGGGSLSHS